MSTPGDRRRFGRDRTTWKEMSSSFFDAAFVRYGTLDGRKPLSRETSS